MLANTLNTNEIKNAAGTEEEFDRLLGPGENRNTEYARINETPAYPHRMKIAHVETGTGVSKRKRSKLSFEKTIAGQVDATQTMKATVTVVLDTPVGNMSSNALANDIVANLMSFMATTGAATTVLFDCTGNGAKSLVLGQV